MINRKRFLQLGLLSGTASLLLKNGHSQVVTQNGPVVISTWDAGLAANKGAWEVLSAGGSALDAVENGVKITEATQNCCVGLGANPDRDGIVTLDASIMDHQFNCGSVGFLERIKHPISVARRVMEKTPHVILVGSGAQQFAVEEGFPLEPQTLSPDAQNAYKKWLENSKYEPAINRENKGHGPFAPEQLDNGDWNHDTIGMLAMDATGNLSGSCTTSGMGFKMRGRLGDSPIIGAGLFVDNEVGACVATGQGEDVIRVAGSHSVVEMMRQGFGPEVACKKIIERIVKIKKENAHKIQVAFIAINKNGVVGAYAIHKGFNYAIKTKTKESLVDANYHFTS
ncbi:N(4)-(beta-N-acetylglucosaminyl)-L-asparaginase [Niabella beijingensis]|uniref:N(4)-(beta-N-acetylglucosaminyl)-L-asparaginase n=1 Tax=Niabella beijingensis TaxID=2872700 RepID=UPI001CC154AC|nr:N(4)-(beta-N-acetylglucosaminyl)-L-asparaginase [Niabella beijingensis]MBZ4192131.1 N(4)-(beta-N-acetylglucosaminyl)-L-asparaginase [Niabella beijingensis]